MLNLGKVGEANVQIRADISQFSADVNRAGPQIQRQTAGVAGGFSGIRQQASLAGAAIKTFIGVAAAGAIVQVGQAVIGQAAAWRQLEVSVQRATGAGDAGPYLEKLFALAQRVNAPLAETVGIFNALQVPARELGRSEGDIDTVTEAIARLAGSAADANGAKLALTQFNQALQGGVLQAEEYGSIVDGFPELLDALAGGLGVTRGQLRSLVVDGGIPAQEIFDALIRQAPELAEKYQATAGSSTRLRNEFIKQAGQAGTNAKVLEALQGVYDELIGILGSPRTSEAFGIVAQGIATTLEQARTAIQGLADLSNAYDQFLLGLQQKGAAAASAIRRFKESLGLQVDPLGIFGVTPPSVTLPAGAAPPPTGVGLRPPAPPPPPVAPAPTGRSTPPAGRSTPPVPLTKPEDVEAVATAQDRVTAAVSDTALARERDRDALRDLATDIARAKLSDVERRVAEDLDRLSSDALPEVRAEYERLARKRAEDAVATEAQEEKQRELKAAQEEGVAVAERYRTAQETLAATLKTLKAQLDADVIGQDTFNRAQTEAIREAEDAAVAAADAAEERRLDNLAASNGPLAGIQLAQAQLKDEVQTGAQIVADAYTGAYELVGNVAGDFVTGQIKSFKDLREAASEFLGSLAQQLAQQGIMRLFAGTAGPGQGGNAGGPAAAGGGLLGGVGALFGFAGGGVMTSRGPLQLKRYAAGGIADSPQLAMFGEGTKREAYVPLDDGRSIPVTMKGGSAGGAAEYHFHQTFQVGRDASAMQLRQAAEMGSRAGFIQTQADIPLRSKLATG